MENSKPSDFAHRILIALDLCDMKPAELAERSGISKPSISQWMNGKYQPKSSALHEMSKVLGVSEMWLDGYDVPMERPEWQIAHESYLAIINRIKKDNDFMRIVGKINNLSKDQLLLIETLISQFTNNESK